MIALVKCLKQISRKTGSRVFLGGALGTGVIGQGAREAMGLTFTDCRLLTIDANAVN